MATIENIKVLVMQQMPDAVLDRIAKVDPRVKVVDARGWFDVELRATWPQWTVDRYLGSRKSPATTFAQRKQALASAEIVLVGWPPVKDIRVRAPRLKWIHELPVRSQQLSRHRSVGFRCYRDDFARSYESPPDG